MTALISKVQYKRSEKGEFHDIASRTFENTIALILTYPWNTERSLASVELTCPSITIEHPVGTCLKIGPYFSGKFSLYYLDTSKKVYLKTINSLEEAIFFIQTYFEKDGKLEGFEKYGFIINAKAHFETNPFEYTVDGKALRTFFIFPIILFTGIILMGYLKYMERPENFKFEIILIMLGFFLFFSSPIIYFFFNYLKADKGAYLQISKGHNEFTFGKEGNNKTYYKDNIVEINFYRPGNPKSLIRHCEIYIISFNNEAPIKFTSLLISSEKLRMKLPEISFINNEKNIPTFKSV